MTSADSERKVRIFKGSYSAILPPGIGFVDDYDFGQRELKEQFYFLEVEEMRIDVMRSIVSPSFDVHPRIAQSVFIHPAALELSDLEIMSLIQTEEYRDLGLSEMTKLSLNKPVIDWWGYDPAPGIMYSFNIRVPCGEASRRHLNEVICVHRYLDDTFDWRKHLNLSNDSTSLSPEQIRAFAETKEMRLATRLVSSIEPTADFAPCCKPPFDK